MFGWLICHFAMDENPKNQHRVMYGRIGWLRVNKVSVNVTKFFMFKLVLISETNTSYLVSFQWVQLLLYVLLRCKRLKFGQHYLLFLNYRQENSIVTITIGLRENLKVYVS